MKESFLLYKSFYEPVKDLSLEDKGALLDAIFQYQIDGVEPFNTSRIYIAFKFIKNQFRLDDKKYQKIIDRNKINGAKGGRPKLPENEHIIINPKKPKKPSGLFGNPDKPKKADKDNVNDNVNEKEIQDIYFEYSFFRDDFAKIWFDEFIPLKKKKKAAVTERALKSQLKKIAGFANNDYNTALKILEKSVDSGWPDFYQLKTNGIEQTSPKLKLL